jgi:hypothetical protein
MNTAARRRMVQTWSQGLRTSIPHPLWDCVEFAIVFGFVVIARGDCRVFRGEDDRLRERARLAVKYGTVPVGLPVE